MKAKLKIIVVLGVLALSLVGFNIPASQINKSSIKVPDPLLDKNHMVYIKYHYTGNNIPVSKTTPTEVWRVGYKQMKSLESYSVEDNIRDEIISNEPDAWILDLVSKTGRHMIDPANGNIHSPILPDQNHSGTDGVAILEFGNEYSFMRNNAKQLKDEKFLDVKVHHYYLEVKEDGQNDTVDLYTDIKSNYPVKMKVSTIDPQSQEKSDFEIIYEVYNNKQVPNPLIFKIDPDFKISEAHS